MSEQVLGQLLTILLAVCGGMAISMSVTVRMRRHEDTNSAWESLEAVIAAMVAYGIYVGAALLANAEFPRFLRDHLFDGLAPAALVAFLIRRFPHPKDGALPLSAGVAEVVFLSPS
jgi:hypothetical protein